MGALRKMEVSDEAVVSGSIGHVSSSRKILVLVAAPGRRDTSAAATKKESRIKNIALFMVAPFIGLAYAMLFPFFAIGALAWMGGKALIEIAAVRAALRAARKWAMMLAAPVIGLAFVVLLPVAGLATLAWIGLRGHEPVRIAIR